MYKLASEIESLNSITSKKVSLLIILDFLDQNIDLTLCFIYAILLIMLIMLIRKIAQG